MTRAEVDALVRDLARIGVQVKAVDPRPSYDGAWQITCWCLDPPHSYTIRTRRCSAQRCATG
jgi:hypothetical protein